MSEESADARPKKSKNGLIISLVAVALLGGGTAAWLALAGQRGAEDGAAAAQKLPPQFVELDPPFVVNFQPGSSARFLQVAVQVMTRDEATLRQLEHLTPIIRNDLLMLFGNKQVAEVSSPEAKEALRAATLDAVRRVVASENGRADSVEAVYFTSFVMQ